MRIRTFTSIAAWAALWVADAGFLQANQIQFRHHLDQEYPSAMFTREQATRYRRNDAAVNLAIGALGPIGAAATFVITGVYQDGWVSPFSRDFWTVP